MDSTFKAYDQWMECIRKDDTVPLEGLFQEGLTKEQWIRILFDCCDRSHDAEKCLTYAIEWGTNHIENVSNSEIMFVGDQSILIYASCQDSQKCFSKLLENVIRLKLSVDHRTEDHWTALHYCAYNSNKTGCQELLSKGADANVVDLNGYSPLIRAAEAASPEVLSIILAAEPDVNHQNHKKWAALHFAGTPSIYSLVY